MRYYIIVLSLFALISCKKNEAKKVSNEFKENAEIEVYNFEQLENFLKADQEQTYVVNFWATWCKPCIKELPYFEELQVKYKGDIKVILVSLDFPSKLESQLIPFITDKKIQSQVILLDDPYENEWIPKVDSTWSGALPATLIFNSTKRKFFEQSFSREELENEIMKFKNL
jgi:thiol-disulfide isomerase/thioredoxin